MDRLRECEKIVLRRIFGSKREEVTGSWRKHGNDKPHNIYTLQIKEDEKGM
jgi:hypothetical protein